MADSVDAGMAVAMTISGAVMLGTPFLVGRCSGKNSMEAELTKAIGERVPLVDYDNSGRASDSEWKTAYSFLNRRFSPEESSPYQDLNEEELERLRSVRGLDHRRAIPLSVVYDSRENRFVARVQFEGENPTTIISSSGFGNVAEAYNAINAEINDGDDESMKFGFRKGDTITVHDVRDNENGMFYW